MRAAATEPPTTELSPEPPTRGRARIRMKRPLIAANEQVKRREVVEVKNRSGTRWPTEPVEGGGNLSSMVTAAGVSKKKKLYGVLVKDRDELIRRGGRRASRCGPYSPSAVDRSGCRAQHLQHMTSATTQPAGNMSNSYRPQGTMKAPATAQPAGIM